MLLGICLNMPAQDGRKLGMDLVPAALGAGFDFVEISVMNTMTLGDREFVDLIEKPLMDIGAKCLAMNSFSPPTLPFIGEGARGAALDYSKKAFERAAMIGAKTVVLGSGVSRSRPVGMTRDEAERELLPLFSEMGSLAKGYGVTLALEGLNRGETNMFCTIPEAVDAAKKAGIKALADYFHFSLGNEDASLLTGYADELAHVHFARLVGRILPIDAREDDGYLPFLSALASGGYKGAISIEAFCPDNFDTRAKKCVQVTRELVKDAGFEG